MASSAQTSGSTARARVSIVGASGYAGGDLVRMLLGHPNVYIAQVTSESNAGKYIHAVHPNLRKVTDLQFISAHALQAADVIVLALPHGESQKKIERFAGLAPVIIDLAADFRLRDLSVYQHYYGEPHSAPEWLNKFVYGLPELHREALRSTKFASGVGCNATAATLALLPLVRAGLLDLNKPITVEVKVGSSEAGASASASSHHPERSGVARTFAATGHRHEAEVFQNLGIHAYLTITSIEMVRGAFATAQAFAVPGLEEKAIWKAYRSAYNAEPFVRIVHDKNSLHHHPEPKLLAGTNFADVGWEYEPETGRIVAMAAIDNLGKGAAGSALQCLNLMLGFDETAGLAFPGLHP